MKKEISLYQFITISLTLLTIIIGAWINFSIKVADINARVINLEQEQVRFNKIEGMKIDKTTFLNLNRNMNHRLEVIQEGQQKIYELLINKQE